MGGEEQQHLQDIVAGFATAMLVTRTRDGGMHARPLALASDPQANDPQAPDQQASEHGTFYFATSLDSPKVQEIEAEPRVLVTFQGKARWAAVYGSAEVVRDAALIDRLWSEDWRVFFPEGRTDPTLCLLAIRPESGEYWDDRGVAGLAVSARTALAKATGHRLATDEAHDHARVRKPDRP